MFRKSCQIVHAIAFALSLVSTSASENDKQALRTRESIDSGWRFHLGDSWPGALRMDKAGVSGGPASPAFDDREWRVVRLPHDWAVELPFDATADRNHGYKALGPAYPENSVAWYRRPLKVGGSKRGRRFWLVFDGIFRDATLWLNGWLLTRHEGGYDSIREDVTDLLKDEGENVLSVRVDASQFEGWFYEGAGIYRHAWIESTNDVAIAPEGIFVRTESASENPTGPAEVSVDTQVLNQGERAEEVRVAWEVHDPDGRIVAEGGSNAGVRIEPGRRSTICARMRVQAPLLWSPETPRLYQLLTRVFSKGIEVDELRTRFGIRTFRFDPAVGFLLNGARYEIHGTCNHQDHAGVGVALPDALQDFRIKRLKEFGCNAYRTAHHPPTPELLDACDRLGMLVMDENRLLGSDARNLDRLEKMILRDRNHPAIFIWSLANEELEVHDTPEAGRVAKTMQACVKRLDASRAVTYAANEKNVFKGINSVVQVRGWNYHLGAQVDDYHAEHPEQAIIGTEQASVVGTRGNYENDYSRGRVNALDIVWPGWDTTAESWWRFFAARPWMSGAFAWTGFDYRGEPSPCNWPSISSHFGILDTCGFPKDSFYYYKAWWTEEPTLHLAPHWNWQGREGQKVLVQVLGNCSEVELFVNGASKGRKRMERLSKLFWDDVVYQPGVLSAKGYDAKGRVVVETSVTTTGPAVRLRLLPDRTEIAASGADVAVFTVCAVDAEDRVVPLADDRVEFQVVGDAEIVGVGNGDPNCHDPDVFFAARAGAVTPAWWRRLYNGYGQVIVRSKESLNQEFRGRVTLKASAPSLESAAVDIAVVAVP